MNHDKSNNVWGIKEYKSDGANCPIVPVNLPAHKKFVLFFFRFGVCPACVTMSLVYNITKFWKKMGNNFRATNMN